MFILNTTLAVKIAWNIIQSFMRESTKKKISLTNNHSDPELFNFADRSQVEEKFGGDASNIDIFWPPTMPSDEYDYDSDYIVSEDEYINILENNDRLRPMPDLIPKHSDHSILVRAKVNAQEDEEFVDINEIQLDIEDSNTNDKHHHGIYSV